MKRHPLFRNIRFIYWNLYKEYNLKRVAVARKRHIENTYNIKTTKDLDNILDPEFINNIRWEIQGYYIDIDWCNNRIDSINRNLKREAILLG